ncbi:MAG: DUF3048 domain-containing protein [Acidimicrobiia bacterium]
MLAAAVVASCSGGGSPKATKVRKRAATVTTAVTTTATTAAPRLDHCPLTGLPAPAGGVPLRPALLVKIGNEPGPSRPQSGLNEADVVFDTPAEGFIMRYIAAYQCGDASKIGPLRSVRWVDYHLAPPLGSSILAYAGGIDPNLAAAANQPGVIGLNLLKEGAASTFRTRDRRPPDNLYTSTQALYGRYPTQSQTPKPLFLFGSTPPAGALPLASAELRFSGGTDVVWKWQPATSSWLHTYRGAPDVDALTGQPVTATNVVVQVVPFTIGPYPESKGAGSGDVQSETTGKGLGYVLTNGQYVAVVWSRPTLADPTTFTTANGQPVSLTPGRTWVELVTTTQAATGIQFTP